MAERASRRRAAAPIGRAAVLALGLGLALGLTLAGGVGAGASGPGLGDPVAAQVPDQDRPQLPGGERVDPGTAREAADDILAGPEYQGPDAPRDTVVDRIRRWINDRFDRGDRDLAPDPGNGPAFVIAGVVVAGAAAAIAWTVVGARRTRRRPDDEADAEVDVTPLRTTEEWDEEAERCLRAGDHRGAVRARYRALTTALAERGLVADTPGRTAGEQRQDVADRAPALAPAFTAVADLFERVWFGAEAAGPAEAQAARDLATRALAAAPRAPRPEADEPERADDGEPA